MLGGNLGSLLYGDVSVMSITRYSVFSVEGVSSSSGCLCALERLHYLLWHNLVLSYNEFLNEGNRNAINRNWGNQKANPALKTKTGNK